MKKEYRSNEERIFAGFRRFNKILKREEFGHHGKTRILNILTESGPMSQRELQEEVEITDEGRQYAELLNKEKSDKTKKLFSALTEEEKEQFAAMLDKIQQSWYDEGLFYGDSRRHRIKHLGKNC